jgi:hypothetical protein
MATAAGCTVTTDGLHAQVVAHRFGEDAGWKLRGYSIPFLFPEIGDWSWQEVGELRGRRNMARFRAVLREIEQVAVAETGTGGIWRLPPGTHMSGTVPQPSRT